MDKDARDKLRAEFELQIRHQFYKKPEFPFLPSMGCYNVFWPVRNEEYDFGFLILEWEPLAPNVWNWVSVWVDTEEELRTYKYKRESSQIKVEVIARIFAERMAQAHHREMMRQKEMEEEPAPEPLLN